MGEKKIMGDFAMEIAQDKLCDDISDLIEKFIAKYGMYKEPDLDHLLKSVKCSLGFIVKGYND